MASKSRKTKLSLMVTLKFQSCYMWL